MRVDRHAQIEGKKTKEKEEEEKDRVSKLPTEVG